jgi:transposase
MRSIGTPAALAWRRQLAVARVSEGYSVQEVADFLEVEPRSVRRWLATLRRHGAAGLAALPVPGRPRKLSASQEKIVRRWLGDCPTEHGFATDLWTAARLAQLIEQEWDIHFHPDYLTAWLRQRGYTPQKPRRVARERDDEAMRRWLAQDWPRIKKRRAAAGRACCGWTKAAC